MQPNLQCKALEMFAACFASESLEPILNSSPTNPRVAIGTIGVVSRLPMKSDEDSIEITADELSVLIYFDGDQVKNTIFRAPVTENKVEIIV